MDELDPTDGAPFVLNVSSPGLDRPLKTEKDFLKKIGTDVEISLYKALDGEKKIVGKLLAYEDGKILLQAEKGEITIETKDIALAKPYITF